MMVILERRSSSPNWEMSHPSMRIEPFAGSMMRNRARVSDDLPAPVRPTIPTFRDMCKNNNNRIKAISGKH